MAQLLNENIIKGKWNELKGKLQNAWGDLTNDEIDYAQGDLNRFYGTVQQKYGQSQQEVQHKLNSFIYPSDDTSSTNLANRQNDEVPSRPLR